MATRTQTKNRTGRPGSGNRPATGDKMADSPDIGNTVEQDADLDRPTTIDGKKSSSERSRAPGSVYDKSSTRE